MGTSSHWTTESFSLHREDDRDILEKLASLAKQGQKSAMIRHALRLHLFGDPVRERLERIERLLEQGVVVGSGQALQGGGEDPELADQLKDLIG